MGLLFDFEDDVPHGLDDLDGVGPHRGFPAQHDGVGAVKHRIGHVRHLRAGGRDALDHGLHHLGGHDDRLAVALAQPDDPLLYHRHLLHRHLDPEVTPGDHDGVRGLDNALQVIYRLGLFDLGDDARMAVRRFDALAQVHHIGRGSHETQAHPVHAEGQGKGQVFPVLLRQAGQTDVGGR